VNSDSAFTIGNNHLICEDYAITDSDEDSQYTVVCDGCSSSSMTDVGARLVAHSALKALREKDIVNKREIDNYLAELAFYLIGLSKDKIFCELPDTCFDATVLAIKSSGKGANVIAIGDGVIAYKLKGGLSIEIKNIEYPNGYPRYLSYRLDRYRELEFLNTEPFYRLHEHTLGPHYRGYKCTDMPVEEEYYYLDLSDRDLEWVAVFSDGVHSFRDGDGGSLYYAEIVRALTEFKNYTGEFVTRRLNKFKKMCIKKGWTHYDDVSMAAIFLGD